MEERELIKKIKRRIRAMSEEADEEVSDLISSCRQELEKAGVYGDESNPLYYQAMVLYCKSHYGYDENTERFLDAFGCLRDSMALSGDFEEGETADDSGIDME